MGKVNAYAREKEQELVDLYDELDTSCDRECCDWKLDPIEFGYKDADINTIDW